ILNRYYEALFSTFPSWRQLPLLLVAYAIVFGIITWIESSIWFAWLWPALQSGLKLAELNAIQDRGPFLVAFFVTLIGAIFAMVAAHLLTMFILLRIIAYLMTQIEPSKGGLVMNSPAIDANAQQLVKEFDIRTPSIMTSGGNLSGGNQQKMIVAREFSRKPRL